MARALIIDDETTARSIVRALLAEHPDVEIVGEADTLRAARELLHSATYDLVFLDINLTDGSGFDLMPDVDRKAHVVFVTGANQHALRAFEVNALDYVVKPVTPTRLAETLRRFGQHRAKRVDSPSVALRLDDIIQLASSAQARFAEVGHVSAIEAEENYSRVYLNDGETILVRRTLKAWMDILPPGHFVRVHRTMIVNLARISRYRQPGPKTVALDVTGVTHSIAVGRQFWPDLKARLDKRFPRAMALSDKL
jgi:two-component system LytT family response regulator